MGDAIDTGFVMVQGQQNVACGTNPATYLYIRMIEKLGDMRWLSLERRMLVTQAGWAELAPTEPMYSARCGSMWMGL